MKQNHYEIEKNIEKLLRGESTGFLTQNISKIIKSRLKKKDCKEYYVYPDADKVILYSNSLPSVKLYRIDCYHELKHSSILGSLFALNITSEMFGDIVFFENSFYIYLLDSVSKYVEDELVMIGDDSVKLVEVPFELLANYCRNYEKIEQIVSSLRIDTICSKLVGCNRDNIREMIKDKNIILNYEEVKKSEILLHEGDVFSIRKHGKYHFKKIIGESKKGNYIILIEKYI